MNNTNKILLLIGVGLVLLIPFASTSPDGLEKVIESLSTEKPAPIWNGLTPSLLASIIGNSYVATIFDALIGLFTVLAVACIIGWASFRRKRANAETR